MEKSKLLAFALTLLSIGNVCAEEVDTLKIVDVEEILVIAAPKENRKLRELPNAVTLLSQQDMQAAPSEFHQEPERTCSQYLYSRLRFTSDVRCLYPRHRFAHQHSVRGVVC